MRSMVVFLATVAAILAITRQYLFHYRPDPHANLMREKIRYYAPVWLASFALPFALVVLIYGALAHPSAAVQWLEAVVSVALAAGGIVVLTGIWPPRS